MGYLTGPARRIVHGDNPSPPVYICYFSIWKKQSDGAYKVFIDQGISTPEPVSFAPGFNRAPTDGRFRAGPRAPDARASLEAADRAFSTAAKSAPPADVYRRFLTSAGRLYRDGVMPLTDAAAAVAWLRAAPATRMATEPLHAESAGSGEFGFTYGRYTLTETESAESGHYVRVWVRDERGAWRIAFDLTVQKPGGPGGPGGY